MAEKPTSIEGLGDFGNIDIKNATGRGLKKSQPSWLVHWNPDNDPITISCTKAFDIMIYCGRPPQLFSAYYRTGKTVNCSQQLSDFNFCMRMKMKAMSDYEGTKKLLEEHSKASGVAVAEDTPHPVFKMRKSPPGQWARIMEE
mmetsp:Transcript_12569/g.17469  ORF Transcript_12569/g.17469 Transcript_12569/m.17469 type:complete len:143 (+) Transcript_12569:37-465(+)